MKNCKGCQTLFAYASNNQRYCAGCQSVVCGVCKMTFTNKNHHAPNKTGIKTCSLICRAVWMSENVTPPSRKGAKQPNTWNKGKSEWGVWVNCAQCAKQVRKKSYQVRRSRHNFCTPGCTARFYLGDGTKTSEMKRLRRSKEFAEWRRAVFERDNYTCRFCGEQGGRLHPDHIKQFAYFPELRFVLSNGRTLCVRCHRKTETWGRRIKRAEADYAIS